MMMAETKTVQISGVARPTKRMRFLAETLHGKKFADSVDSMLEDAIAVDALAGAIDRALVEGTSKDGRIDLKVTAAALMRELKNHQR